MTEAWAKRKRVDFSDLVDPHHRYGDSTYPCLGAFQ